ERRVDGHHRQSLLEALVQVGGGAGVRAKLRAVQGVAVEVGDGGDRRTARNRMGEQCPLAKRVTGSEDCQRNRLTYQVPVGHARPALGDQVPPIGGVALADEDVAGARAEWAETAEDFGELVRVK